VVRSLSFLGGCSEANSDQKHQSFSFSTSRERERREMGERIFFILEGFFFAEVYVGGGVGRSYACAST
jgi:hypothetical protein